MTRAEFIFIIGYDGATAIVSGADRRRYGSLSTPALLERGLFRAAYASAIYEDDASKLQLVVSAWNCRQPIPSNAKGLGTVLGVSDVPEGIKNVTAI